MDDQDFAAGRSRSASVVAGPYRLLWLLAGWLSLVLAVIGLLLPLLPSVPFVLLAAACFSRGSERWERWILDHPRLGPAVRDWRAHRAVPLRAKQAAWVMMSISSTAAWFTLPRLKWLPAACCLAVGLWLWRLPTRHRSPDATSGAGSSPNSGSE